VPPPVEIAMAVSREAVELPQVFAAVWATGALQLAERRRLAGCATVAALTPSAPQSAQSTLELGEELRGIARRAG